MLAELEQAIRNVPDFPKPGIQFKDITPLLGNARLFAATVDMLIAGHPPGSIHAVAGIDARGFLFASAAALKTQLTLKGVSESLIVTRPAGTTLDKDELQALSSHNTTLAVFLGIDKIREIMESLDRPVDTPVAVVYHASWPDEIVLRGTIDDIADKAEAAGLERSALILVGAVVSRTGFRRSHLYRDR